MTSKIDIRAFRRVVWNHWKKNGRHDLPWRKTQDPYKILVSEVMLQQTQVPRVLEKYKTFLRKFPTVRALADASLTEVLKEWSGLGYNRRGKYLRDTAQMIVQEFRGDFKAALQHPLPGVGPYTRAAVRVFAFDEPHTMMETNIRTVFIHHFFTDAKTVADKALMPLIEAAAESQDPRTWHWALMDYGSHLKASGVRNNVRSKGYKKQSKFEGSLRQVRGEILRQLHAGKQPTRGKPVARALETLMRDGLVVREGRRWRIA